LSLKPRERSPAYAVKARGVFLLSPHQLFELIVYDTDVEAEDFRVRKTMRSIFYHQFKSIRGISPSKRPPEFFLTPR
jgi:hypothetical protein